MENLPYAVKEKINMLAIESQPQMDEVNKIMGYEVSQYSHESLQYISFLKEIEKNASPEILNIIAGRLHKLRYICDVRHILGDYYGINYTTYVIDDIEDARYVKSCTILGYKLHILILPIPKKDMPQLIIFEENRKEFENVVPSDTIEKINNIYKIKFINIYAKYCNKIENDRIEASSKKINELLK
jgi:hypothetical protein